MKQDNAWLAPASDAHFLNAVANDPTVRDSVAGPIEGALDLTPLLSNRDVICLRGAYGFSIFRRYAPFVYDWHVGVLPEGRGKWALGAGRASMDYLFSRTDAVAVVAAIPGPNRAARHLVSALGFQLFSVLPAAWPKQGGAVPLHAYLMFRKNWPMMCQ